MPSEVAFDALGGPFYREIHREAEIFEHCFKNRLPLMLKGPTGCGKSRFVESMASRLGRELVQVACNEDTSSADLLGRYLVQGGDTVWHDGPVTRAIRAGAILYLDEIAEAREDVVVVLHSLTDHRRQLFIDRRNETLTAPQGFMLVISFNPGYQRALKELKPSTRQRFVALEFGYADPAREAEIVASETGLDGSQCKKLVNVATRIRKLEELGLAETASTRLLVDAARLIRSGMDARLAAEVAIIQPLTDDRPTIEALRDLVSLIL